MNAVDVAVEMVKALIVTMYVRSEFLGRMVKIECRACEIQIAPFAQYRKAVRARFLPKGKRAWRVLDETFRPTLLVLEGHGHPDPDEGWSKVTDTVSRARYSSCDPRWQSDFSTMIDAYIAESGTKVVADYRGHDSDPERFT